MIMTLLPFLGSGAIVWWASGRLNRLPSKAHFPLLPLLLTLILTPVYFLALGGLTAKPLGVQEDVRLYNLIWGGLMLFWAGHVIVREWLVKGRLSIPRLRLYEKMILLFLPASVLYTLVGLAMNNSLDYVVTDMYKYVAFTAVYLATIIAVRPENAMNFLKALYQLLLILLIFNIVQQLAVIGLEGAPQRSGATFATFFLLPYFMSVEASGGTDPVFSTSRVARMFLFGVMIVNIFLSYSRALWVGAVLLIPLFLFMTRRRAKTQVFVTSTITGMLVVVVVLIMLSSALYPSAYKAVDDLRTSRIADFEVSLKLLPEILSGESKADRSLLQKTSEGMDAWKHMRKNASEMNYLLGFGNGAEYASETGVITSRVVSSKGAGFNHQIHGIFFAELFRHGFLGLAYVLTFFAALLFGLYGAWRSVRGTSKVMVGALVLGSLSFIVYQFSIVSIFLSPLYVVALALVGQLIRYETAKSTQKVVTPTDALGPTVTNRFPS